MSNKNRYQPIYLVGFMGAGKSTVGRALALLWQTNLFDLDDLIVNQTGHSIKEIFEQWGEDYFRNLEHRLLKQLVARSVKQRLVIALGGGTFTFERNREVIKGNGQTIWLDCTWEVILARLKRNSVRPLANDPHKLETLFKSRMVAYQEADFRIDVTHLKAMEAAHEIINLLK